MSLDKIPDFLRVNIHYVISGFVIFCLWYWHQPKPYAEFGIVLFAIFLFGDFIKWLINKINSFMYFRLHKKRLQTLSVAEKEILRGYFKSKEKALPLNITAPPVALLINESILVRVSNNSFMHPDVPAGVPIFAVAIQPYIWEYLNKDRGLINP
jgi:hypothetical protein